LIFRFTELMSIVAALMFVLLFIGLDVC
jgi:hypothetical protein